MAGSSRPDLGGGGSFREGPQLSGAGTPRALAEPPPLAQYLPLESFPVGDHKQSRATELRRVLGVTVEAEQSFGLVQTKPLPSIASEELKRIRGGVVESSAKAKYMLLTSYCTLLLQSALLINLQPVKCCAGRKPSRCRILFRSWISTGTLSRGGGRGAKEVRLRGHQGVGRVP